MQNYMEHYYYQQPQYYHEGGVGPIRHRWTAHTQPIAMNAPPEASTIVGEAQAVKAHPPSSPTTANVRRSRQRRAPPSTVASLRESILRRKLIRAAESRIVSEVREQQVELNRRQQLQRRVEDAIQVARSEETPQSDAVEQSPNVVILEDVAVGDIVNAADDVLVEVGEIVEADVADWDDEDEEDVQIINLDPDFYEDDSFFDDEYVIIINI